MRQSGWIIARTFAALLALALFPGCGRTDRSGPAPAAFVERIQPSTYLAAELAFDEPFSRSYELVFLRTDFGKPISALAIGNEPDGTHTIYFGSVDAAGSWRHVTTALEERIGGQVLRAVELRLHRNIMINTQRRDVATNEGDLWIHQRIANGGVAAALVPFAARLENEQGAVFLDRLMGSLEQLAATEGEARRELLGKIDRMATEVILSESPQ